MSDQTSAVPCFEHWLWWYRYFLSKVNICNVNFARATAFNFDTRTGVLVKVSIFFRQKLSRPEGDNVDDDDDDDDDDDGDTDDDDVDDDDDDIIKITF